MKTVNKHKTIFIQVLLLCTIVIIAANYAYHIFFTSEAELFTEIKQKVEYNLAKDITTAKTISLDLVKEENSEIYKNSEIIYLRYETFRAYHLSYWNTNDYIPSLDKFISQIQDSSNSILVDGKHLFYNVKTFQKGAIVFALIPIKKSYNIQNDYVKNYVYNGHSGIKFLPENISLAPSPSGINISLNDSHHFSYTNLTKQQITQSERKVFMYLVLFALLLSILIIRGLLSLSKINKFIEVFSILVLIIGIRAIMLYFGFPLNLSETEIFSSKLLAFNNWNPSLGDFLLNTIGLSFFSFKAFRAFNYKKLAKFLIEKGKVATVLALIAAYLLLLYFLSKYIDSIQFITKNSTLEVEFAKIFQLNLYSLLLFAGFALMLLNLFLLSYWLFGALSIAFLHFFKNYRPRIIYAIIFILLINSVFVLIFSREIAFIFYANLFFFSIYFIRRHSLLKNKERFSSLQAFILLSVLSAVTNWGISKSLEPKKTKALIQYADKYQNSADPMLEYNFGKMLRELPISMIKLKHVSYEKEYMEEVWKMMNEKYFAQNFKAYKANTFIYDSLYRSLYTPINAAKQYNPYEKEIEFIMMEQQTSVPHLFILPDKESPKSNIYIAKFLIIINKLKFYFQIEFVPKSKLPNQLYPLLFIDRQNKPLNAILPENAGIAVYDDNILIDKTGQNKFPIKLKLPKTMKIGDEIVIKDKDNIRLYRKIGMNKTLLLEMPKRTWFEKASSFSFLFYFFIALYFILNAPYYFKQFHSNGFNFNKLPLNVKIRNFFLFTTFLPMMFIIFFTRPFIEDLFREQIYSQLEPNIDQIKTFINQNTPFPKENTRTWDNFTTKLNEISRILSIDINLYNQEGKLIFTTQPRIFEYKLLSPYMNHQVFEHYEKKPSSKIFITDQINQLKYLSAYFPVRTYNENSDEQIFFLNTPYLSRQNLINRQIQSFIVFLMNIYVILIFVVSFISIILSRALTLPLSILKDSIDKISFGNTNIALQWESDDEIGAIIHSYNEMLIKLGESKKKLQTNERDLAWREMAKQVAHEIKNPLTPMKLKLQFLIRAWKSEHHNFAEIFDNSTTVFLEQIESMTNIATNFSNFAKMPAPKIEKVNVHHVLKSILDLYSEANFKLELQNENEFYVNADKDQLSRVVNNLVKNASQAVEENIGRVVMKTAKIEDNKIQIQVIDNGVGIPIEIQDKIFLPSFSTKTSGMGLGLAMSKKIIESFNGEIYFKSVPNRGTIFYIELSECTT